MAYEKYGNMQELIKKWKERLKRFQDNPNIAKDMDQSMGVQHGRIIALQDCIKELEEILAEQIASY